MKVRLLKRFKGQAAGSVVDLPRDQALALIGQRVAVDLGNVDMREAVPKCIVAAPADKMVRYAETK